MTNRSSVEPEVDVICLSALAAALCALDGVGVVSDAAFRLEVLCDMRPLLGMMMLLGSSGM